MLCPAASEMCVITFLWVFSRDSMVRFNKSGEGVIVISVTSDIREKTISNVLSVGIPIKYGIKCQMYRSASSIRGMCGYRI